MPILVVLTPVDFRPTKTTGLEALALSARFARLWSENAEAMTKLREWKAEQEKLPLSLWLLWTVVWLLIVGVLLGVAYLLYLWMQ